MSSPYDDHTVRQALGTGTLGQAIDAGDAARAHALCELLSPFGGWQIVAPIRHGRTQDAGLHIYNPETMEQVYVWLLVPFGKPHVEPIDKEPHP